MVSPRIGWIVAAARWILLVAPLAYAGTPHRGASAEIEMRDGRVLQGMLGALSSLTDQPGAAAPEGVGDLQLIVFLDDNLRRTYVPRRQVVRVNQADVAMAVEKFVLRQPIVRSSQAVKAVGQSLKVTPFDEYGRRTFTFQTARGPVDVVQGITELTPQWAKVEGLKYAWDMRIATSSLPRDVLHKILLRQIDTQNVEHHKRVARFYLQAERFEEAAAQLEEMLRQFPNEAGLREQLEPTLRQLKQLAAQRLLSELRLRRQAGQHALVRTALNSFPSEGVAGELLQAAREMLGEYETLEKRRTETVAWLDEQISKIAETTVRERIKPIRDEIAAELSFETLPRLTAFRQNIGDADLSPAEKTALAVSGWLLGGDNATVRLPVALSAHKVRELIRQYLAEPLKVERDRVFAYFGSEEAGGPSNVTAILAHMKPPLALPPGDEKRPGFYSFEVQVMPKEPAVTYLVQLPPEYDPLRRYPTIVTLNGAGSSAEQQIDWWAGPVGADGRRTGQAGRHGYIVIAPQWTTEHQREYGYSAREHGAVLVSLRDACRRFSIDTDRVFISGHSIGGDAAWDIALAHPDLWAGAIPIVAESDKYVAFYGENAKRLPMYFVFGEYDNNKLRRSARDLDRYFLRFGINVTIVEYLGRGHEHFFEEILRCFDWMQRFRRDFFPREFTARTMRPWDNYFWWVELNGMPANTMVEPAQWAARRPSQAALVSGSINDANGIVVTTASNQLTLWLSPKMIDFEKQATIVVNGRRVNSAERAIEPDLRTLLEDVRTRGDRFNPFWLKVETATGRVGG